MDIQKVFEKYLFWLQYGKPKPVKASTLESKGYINSIIIQHLGSFDITKFNKAMIMDLRRFMIERHNGQEYINKVMIHMRSVLKFCTEELELTVMEPKNIKTPPREKKKIEWYSKETVRFILSSIDLIDIQAVRLRASIALFLDSGLRISELCAFNRNTIDFVTGRADMTGKGDKEGVVFFHDWSLNLLRDYLDLRTDDDPALFITHSAKGVHRIGPKGLRKDFRKLSKKVGFRIHPHKLRKTGANIMIENGAGIFDVKNYLRHSSVKTTEFYYVGIDYNHLQKVHHQCLDYSIPVPQEPRPIVFSWAPVAKHRACLDCGTTEKPHVSKGLCSKCYTMQYRAVA